MPGSYNRNKKIILFAGDLIIVVLSMYLSYLIRFSADINPFVKFTGASSFFIISCLLVFYVFDLYNINYNFKSTSFFLRFLSSICVVSLFMTVWSYFFLHWKIGRGLLILATTILMLFAYSWRLFFQYYNRAFITYRKKIAIVGAGDSGKTIYNLIQNSDLFETECFLDDNSTLGKMKIGNHEVIGDTNLLMEMAKAGKIESVVVAITNEKSVALLENLLQVKQLGIEIYDMPSLYEELAGKLPVGHLRSGWLVYTPFYGVKRSLYTTKIKRLCDIAICIAAGIIILPAIVITALAIKLDSKGPVLYRQKRVGLNARIYEIVKFRSMRSDAEANGAVWAMEKDNRITRIGWLIRKLRIDEIPQFWNVLKGEMSFVGPRPERPEFVEKLEKEIKFYGLRHSVTPGITGWAQVNYRYGASTEDARNKLQYDLFYIKNLSIYLDCQILLKTIRVVLFGEGAR